VTVNPGGGSGWDEPPLDIQIPDDARELDRDVLAYHRELRAQRRRTRLRRLAGPFAPFAAHGNFMPLLASILAVCLVAGAMLSVATFSPAPADRTPSPTTSIPGVSFGPKTTPAAPAPPIIASPSAVRTSRSASPSASSSRTRPTVRTTTAGSPGAPR
jgi:hypothetical protein